MNFISLFAGIGGFDLAFERAGMKCLVQVEIDKNCQNILARHFPLAERKSDVKECNKTNLPLATDLICGGFPCQDLSLAGKRKGLTGERSGLWFEFARIIAELSPQWVVIENVAGLLSSNRGKDFAIILRWLAERGYGVAYRILDAQYFGIPQRRRRLFVVASLNDGRASQVLFEQESLSGSAPQGNQERENTAAAIVSRIGKGGFTDPVNDNIITATLRGFGHGWQGQHNDTNPIIVGALQSRDYKGVGTQYVEESKVIPMWEMQHASEAYRESNGNVAPTLQNRMGTGGNNIPLVGVRRLMPIECERLQGFPDDYTAGQSDTIRYRQLGNAVAVPVVEWIGKRIMAVC